MVYIKLLPREKNRKVQETSGFPKNIMEKNQEKTGEKEESGKKGCV